MIFRIRECSNPIFDRHNNHPPRATRQEQTFKSCRSFTPTFPKKTCWNLAFAKCSTIVSYKMPAPISVDSWIVKPQQIHNILLMCLQFQKSARIDRQLIPNVRSLQLATNVRHTAAYRYVLRYSVDVAIEAIHTRFFHREICVVYAHTNGGLSDCARWWHLIHAGCEWFLDVSCGCCARCRPYSFVRNVTRMNLSR